MREIRGAEKPCDCVFRAIFRACYNRFREYAARGAEAGTVSLEYPQGPVGHRSYSRKREEYVADFCLVTKRALPEFDYKLFRYTFLLGADWRLCTRYLDVDRGNYFHHVYRIEETLGREYAELEPYPLYPLDEYFGANLRNKRIAVSKPPVPLAPRAGLRLPMTGVVLPTVKLTA